jgi:hypothetical protein
LVEGWQPLPLKAREHIKVTIARLEIQSAWYHLIWERDKCFQVLRRFEVAWFASSWRMINRIFCYIYHPSLMCGFWVAHFCDQDSPLDRVSENSESKPVPPGRRSSKVLRVPRWHFEC